MYISLEVTEGDGKTTFTCVSFVADFEEEGGEKIKIVCDGNEDAFYRYLPPWKIVKEWIVPLTVKKLAITTREAIKLVNVGLRQCEMPEIRVPSGRIIA